MLKKANQKRKLDQMVIADGEFTTDHLQKLDWRDYLDDGQLAELGVDATADDVQKAEQIPTQSEAEIRRALAAAEDEEDAAAAKAAVAEIEMCVLSLSAVVVVLAVEQALTLIDLPKLAGTATTLAPRTSRRRAPQRASPRTASCRRRAPGRRRPRRIRSPARPTGG
mgnify:CR=1 FL=1